MKSGNCGNLPGVIVSGVGLKGENCPGPWGEAAQSAPSGGRVNVENSYHLVRREHVTKSEFVDQVADRAGLSKKDAASAVDAVLETIEGALRRGSEISFSGFGKFSVSHRNAREGRNPATGERIYIQASRVPKFSAGAGLKKAVK
jgi:DNA-binding protein HU-beta